ncbi:ANNEXIN [Salix purpurea]|uniref:ANNEXIN n=1 Tax=Salix purpurea TaxID=77065 RepID=A0A9Q0VHU9_SALPP|nr:ANNEXIN [Salix purpurea]
MSTLTVPLLLSSPIDDARHLHRAFKGFRSDKSAVINILAHRDAAQRALIQCEYRALYAEDLPKRLSSELSGNLETALLLWMHDPPGRDAMIVRQAIRKDSLNLETATEVICSRTPSQIQEFKYHYYAKYGVHLEHDIELRASGDHKKVRLCFLVHAKALIDNKVHLGVVEFLCSNLGFWFFYAV